MSTQKPIEGSKMNSIRSQIFALSTVISMMSVTAAAEFYQVEKEFTDKLSEEFLELIS